MRCWPACHTRHSHHCSGSLTLLYALLTVFDREITWRADGGHHGSSLASSWSADTIYTPSVGPPSTGEKSSNLHHPCYSLSLCALINGSRIGHRWWAVHITIEAKIQLKGFSHIRTKSLELSTQRHQTGSLHKQLKTKTKNISIWTLLLLEL